MQQMCCRGCGTDLLAVVNGVGLQVVADVGHDEKGGDVAQFLAPAVLFLQITAGVKLETKLLQHEGAKERHGQILSIQVPIQPVKLRVRATRPGEKARGQTCFGGSVNGVAHGLFTRNAFLGGDGSLKSGDALRHGQGVGGDGYGSSGGGGKRGDDEDFSEHAVEIPLLQASAAFF